MNVLIINGHPTMEMSNANKAILEEVNACFLMLR